MGLGKRLWTLWRLRPWVAACVLVAALVAVWSVAKISLSPPRLTARALEIASATTHVVVDTPRSSVLDLRQNTYDFQALTQRAVLLGNVIANGTVRQAIAARVHIPVAALQVAAPLTAKQPRAESGSGRQPSVGDITKSTNQYQLSIQVNPTVPILDIYAEAPTPDSAATLANAAVDGLHDYLAQLAQTQQIPSQDQIRLLQLGRARGTVINQGIDWQVGVLVFLLTLSFACATTIFVSRVRSGWRMAALADQHAST